MISDEQRFLIARIATAASLEDSLNIFSLVCDQIDQCKFIFASETGSKPGFAVNFDFNDGSAIRSLFNSKKVLVLDKKTLNEMACDDAQFRIDYSISLDTQALSYLDPYMNGFTSKIPNDFKDIFSFISRDDVFIDPMPYIHENYMNINNPNAADKIFNKLKAYETLRTLDKRALEDESVVRSSSTESELIKSTQEYISRMFTAMSNTAFVRELKNSFNHQYIHILKMATIQLNRPNRSVYSKLTEFLDFCHEDLSSIGLREVIIANEFFKKGQKLGFFNKIQKNNPDILRTVNGMAWDLYHIRNMEKLITIRPNKDARYFFPSFLTCDKRLVDIIDLYPLKCCAYMEGELEPMPFFDGNVLKSISSNLDEEEEIYIKYFSSEKQNIRKDNRDFKKTKFSDLAKKLEVELTRVIRTQLVN